jgi:hypothetical protein
MKTLIVTYIMCRGLNLITFAEIVKSVKKNPSSRICLVARNTVNQGAINVVLIIFGEEYKLRSSSLCNFLHPPVTFSVFYRFFGLCPTPSIFCSLF